MQKAEHLSGFIHSTALIDEHATIGEGTKIWHFTHVSTGSKIGRRCVLGQNVYIGKDVRIGSFCKIQNNVSVYEGVTLQDYVFCGPSVVFTNILLPRCKYPQAGKEYYVETLVREGASLGANATILCGITIGRNAMVGAGAVVTRDVADFALMVGNPARRVAWVSESGIKLEFDSSGGAYCKKSKKHYSLKDDSVTEFAK